MNENPTNSKPDGKHETVKFDHEKLDVYHLELKFIGWVTPLLEEISQDATGKIIEVREQLDRASLSILLNTAEDNGKRQRPVRAKYFDDARGSVTECAACLDALIAKEAVSGERVAEGKKVLLRIVSMLCGLIERFDGPTAFHEEHSEAVSGKPEAERNANYCSKISRRR